VTPWIVVDQSVAGALSLTPTPASRPPRVYKNSGTGVQIQSERVYKNPRNPQNASDAWHTARDTSYRGRYWRRRRQLLRVIRL